LAAGCSPARFSLTGSITVAPRLSHRAEQPNTVLFVVASNAAGVPVAVQRIINPSFPLTYRMRNEDLVLPGPVWHGALTIRVFVNTHGQAGVTMKGDLTGSHRATARSGERGVDVVIDREI
jgi:hypothetical protein